jgi:citrate lyase subunit beta/citryl-CoA lyase
MRKSLLFIPGNRENMLKKVGTVEADVIIFDLEDSVPFHEKDKGRSILAAFLKEYRNEGEIELAVRVNSSDVIWKKDIEATAKFDSVALYVIPKANKTIVEKVDQYISEMEYKNRRKSGDIKLIPLIESPEAVFAATEIARASERVTGMLLGAEDYTLKMNVERTVSGDEIFVARSLMAMSCNVAGVEAYDTPFVEINNLAGLEFDTNKGKSLGMTGKAAIHPKQIEIINQAYTPNPEEVERAKQIVEANEEFMNVGHGSFSLKGEMVDLAIVLRAKELLNNSATTKALQGKENKRNE